MSKNPITFVALLAALAGCASPAANSGRIEMAVTDKGFEPAQIQVRHGVPVTLVVTRKTDQTCVTDLVIAEYGIRQALPLNQAVEIKFTPQKTGEVRYACGMDMVGGKLIVE